MSSAHRWTPEEFLTFERAAVTKHEYRNGHVVDWVYGNIAHLHIAMSTMVTLHTQLRKRSCDVFTSQMRIHVESENFYTYPDLSVVCGKALFADSERDNLLNPNVIIEILSSETEQYDRNEKFQWYCSINSLQEYVLISQDKVSVEHYIRQPDNKWLLSKITALNETLVLSSIQCILKLDDIYEKVEF